jgi:putative ABC transport system substrate-binding protein
VAIEYRFSEGQDDKVHELALELLALQVAVLVASDRPSALGAKAATSTVPIIFTSGDDPVKIGLVQSLSNPGGNATGIYLFTTQLGPKRLGLLRELLPNARLIAFVVNPDNTSSQLQTTEMQTAATAVGQELLVLQASNEAELERAFETMSHERVAAVLYGTNTLYQVMTERLIALAAQYKMPAFYEWRDAVVAGGLMSYNTNRNEIGRLVGSYAAQILKGKKPADLPSLQSSNFAFVINLKTARQLNLEIPPTLLARADEVIE